VGRGTTQSGRHGDLQIYKRRHGDCNVPTEGWAEDPPLGRWVNSQRQYKKVLDRGEPSKHGMTAERVAKLGAMGFAWDPLNLDAVWEGWLAKLKAHKAAHGDCNVNQRSAEDAPLGR
jgi:hypothetical protein